MERASDQPAPLAGSDAERRAAVAVAARLREAGRSVVVETVWVRPRGELTLLLHAGLGVLASLLAVSLPAVGLALALVALLSLLLDLSGRLFLLRRFTPERATQNVVATPPAAGTGAPHPPGEATAGERLQVILVAHADAPRGGLLRRFGAAPASKPAASAQRRRGVGPLRRVRLPRPALLPVVALALLAVAGFAAARLAGAEGTALGALQLLPTLALLIAAGLALDSALADAAPADAVGPEVLVAAARALDAAPPRRLALSVVLAGAGSAQALGFRAWLRRTRPEGERTVVVEVGAADAPTWWSGDGALLPLRYHPRLVALAQAAAAEEPRLEARPRRGRTLGAALRARQRRLPAVRLGAPTVAGALALTLAFVELLDERGG